MPTLTASPAARIAAQRLGLAPSPSPKQPASPAASKLQLEPAAAAPAGNEAPASAAPSALTEKAKAWRKQQRAARDHLWPLLSAAYPEVFRVPPVPLAIGIHKQILEVAGEDIDPRELSAFMTRIIETA